MSDLVGQYISTINQGIAYTFERFRAHQYYEAAHDLLPILHYVIVNSDEDNETIENVIVSIEEISKTAKEKTTGYTQAARQYNRERIKNAIAYELYLKGIKQIKQAIKKDILQGRAHQAATLTELRNPEGWDEE